MNSYRNYSNNVSSLSSNLEKLSSGYKINRAGDDAAGLAISEKMRAQIQGLDAAEKNVADGISLVKTGEGAMQEIQDMLSRMKYLATQSANGTYDDDVDRANLQKEVDALKTEINRIADSSNFNGINLLDGSLSGKSQVENVAMDMSVATKGKYSTTNPFAATQDLALTTDDIGKTIDVTVTWKADANSEEQTSTVSLTFQGDGKGAVSSDWTKNYVTDANGNKLNFAAGSAAGTGTLTDAQLASGFLAGLKSNDALSNVFNISSTSNGLTFEAKTAGSAGAVVTGISTSTTTSAAKDDVFDAGTSDVAGDLTIDKVAYDSMQKFDATKLVAAQKTETAEDINSHIFTIDGSRFLLSKDLTDDQIKALDSDITVVKIAGANPTATEASTIAAQISRVTGLTTKVYTTAPDADTKITTNDIVFTKDKLSLTGNELTLQIGDTADSYNQMGVKIDDMHTTALGLDDVDISTIEGATSAIETIKNAINSVSMTRGTLGAVQNRLEHTANNLSVMNENISDAESTIRDTDIAEEMTAYTKNNILVQSAQAMLAQANSVPLGVLQLLH
jgi:flagellin